MHGIAGRYSCVVSVRFPAKCPPQEAAPVRLPRLLPPRAAALKGRAPSPQLEAALDASEAALAACSADPSAPAVVYVSKMVAVPASALPRLPGEPGPACPDEERFLAFGRVFSGVLRQGQAVRVLPATYNPADPAAVAEAQELPVTELYLMMGRGLERLAQVGTAPAACQPQGRRRCLFATRASLTARTACCRCQLATCWRWGAWTGPS